MFLIFSKFIKPTVSFFIFLIVEIIILTALLSNYSQEKQSYTNELIGRLKTVVNAVVNMYGLVSQTILEEVINKPEIINLFKHAHTANIEEQAVIRQKMYEKLQSTYENLQRKNLRQLHFHFPNNISFLRMHKPEHFGDDLSSVRYSIKLANELKKPVQGFEEGRTFNGFRYVFPLFDETTHIGSVEVSMSFDGIHQEITKLYPLHYQMILKKNIVFGTVFSSEQNNYVSCLISDEYMCENDKIRKLNKYPFSRTTMKDIDNALKNQLNKELDQDHSFVSNIKLQGINYILIFYPIKNLHEQVVSYTIGYHENNHFVELENDLFLKLLVFSLLNILTFLFVHNIQYNQRVIQQKNQTLIKADQEKNEFLSIVVHDLKNPLSGIQTFSEEIKSNFEQLSKEEIVEFSELINDSSNRMFALVSNLLDISAIESGKFHLDFQQVNLLPIVKNIIQVYQTPAQTKRLAFQLNVNSNPNPVIYADKNAVVQIIDNLISNAVKYSLWKKVILIDIDVKQGMVTLKIKNESEELTETDLQKLFNKFSKLSTKPTNGEHSTGLGLFIVKKLADSIHANIKCESKKNQGVIFIVDFPQMNTI